MRLIISLMIVAVIVCQPSTASAQGVSFTAASKRSVQEGERFRVQYSINAQGESFRGPSFEGFKILSGPSVSTNTNVQIVNGQVKQSANYTYSYIVQAVKQGNYKIPAASIVVSGKSYKSNALSISVVKGNPPPTQQKGQQSQQGSSGNISNKDVFLKALVNKTSPYIGEEVIITYKLYTRIRLNLPNYSQQPSFKGFWTENLMKDVKSLKQTREVVNGSEYVVVEYRKTAIFPQKSGKVIIDPFEMTVVLQVAAQKKRSNDPFGDFFNNPFFQSYQNVEKKIKSNAVTLNVKALPLANKPAEFSGLVGRFNMTSSIDREELKTNEALNLKIGISGSGNIRLIGTPKASFPPDFETYDPKISGNVTANLSGVSGRRTFEYLVIPRTAGTHLIKPIQFSYFDLDKKQFVTLSSPEYVINVEKGAGGESGGGTYTVNREDIKYIGTDIRYIKNAPFHLNAVSHNFFGSNSFVILMLLPLFLFAILFVMLRRNARLSSNAELLRNRRATKTAKNSLKAAEKELSKGGGEAYYIELSKALWGYLGDKFNIPRSDLSIEVASEQMKQNNISEETSEVFIGLLNQCEYARFAPGGETSEMQDMYRKSIEIIKSIEKELK